MTKKHYPLGNDAPCKGTDSYKKCNTCARQKLGKPGPDWLVFPPGEGTHCQAYLEKKWNEARITERDQLKKERA